MLNFRASFRIQNMGIKVKRKFFYGLLLGMLIFCIIPVSVATLLSSYYYSSKIIKEYEEENIDNLNKVMLNNSSIMQEFKTHVSYVTDSDMSFFSSHIFYDDITRYNKLIDKLLSHLFNSNYIDSIYLYSKKFDYIASISSNGDAFSRDLSSKMTANQIYDNGWLGAFENKQYFKVIYRDNYIEGRDCLSYIIPAKGKEKNAIAALVINIQFEEIVRSTNQVLNDHKKNIYMMIDNNIIQLTENFYLNIDDLNKHAGTKDLKGQFDKNGEEMIVNRIYDPYMDIVYISVVPKRILTADLRSILRAYYIIVILFVILVISIAWVYTKFLYKPLEQLLKIVSNENSGDYTNLQISEFQLVLNEYKNLINTKNLMMAKLEANKLIFRERFLNSLLKGHISQNIENKIMEYDIDLKGREYLVLLIYIEHQDVISAEDWDKWQKIKELIQNAVDTQFEQKNIKGALCSLENGGTAIIISQNKKIADEFIQSFVESLIQYVGTNIDKEAHIGISRILDGLNNIPDGYKQAQQALRLGILNKKSRIHYYTDLPDQHNRRIEYRKILNEFIVILKDYNEKNLDRFIENIMDKVQKEFDNALQVQAYYIKIVVNIIDYIENMLNIDYQCTLAEFCKNLIKCRINSEIRNVLNNVLNDVVQKWIQAKDNISIVDENVNNTVEYIHQYYTESSMGLEFVAGHVGLNPSYLSRIFKRVTGMPFQKYLAKIRVEKACELLVESDMQIYNISSNVGFGSPLSFNRTFKKIEGCSPKEYRENHQKS